MSERIPGDNSNIIKKIRDQAEKLYQDYQDGNIPLRELAAFFKIDGISNEKRYEVKGPIFEGEEKPFLFIRDLETGVVYYAGIKDDNKNLGIHPDFRLGKPLFIVNEKSFHYRYEIEKAYFTDSDTPIYEQLAINDDRTQYGAIPQIVFRRDYTRGVDNSITSKTLSIKYRLLEPRTEKHENGIIMARIDKEKVLLCDSYGQLLEPHGNENQNNWHVSTIQKPELLGDNTLVMSSQLFGGKDSLTFRTWFKNNAASTTVGYFGGVCIENTKDIQEGCYPATTKISKHFKTIEPDTISAISFKGGSLSGEKWTILILKKPYSIQIQIPNCPKPLIIKSSFNGTIQSSEIDHIIDVLNAKAGSLKSIQCVIPQLQLFAEKLETRDYDLVEASNPLNPQILWNIPLENILELCAYHRNTYFKIMQDRLQPEYKPSFRKKPGETGNNQQ